MAGKQVKLFLVDGAPGGLTTAEITNWTGHVLAASRSDVAGLLTRKESQRTGVYLLLGDDDGSTGGTRCYIGEGDVVAERLHDGAIVVDGARGRLTRDVVVPRPRRPGPSRWAVPATVGASGSRRKERSGKGRAGESSNAVLTRSCGSTRRAPPDPERPDVPVMAERDGAEDGGRVVRHSWRHDRAEGPVLPVARWIDRRASFGTA